MQTLPPATLERRQVNYAENFLCLRINFGEKSFRHFNWISRQTRGRARFLSKLPAENLQNRLRFRFPYQAANHRERKVCEARQTLSRIHLKPVDPFKVLTVWFALISSWWIDFSTFRFFSSTRDFYLLWLANIGARMFTEQLRQSRRNIIGSVDLFLSNRNSRLSKIRKTGHAGKARRRASPRWPNLRDQVAVVSWQMCWEDDLTFQTDDKKESISHIPGRQSQHMRRSIKRVTSRKWHFDSSKHSKAAKVFVSRQPGAPPSFTGRA